MKAGIIESPGILKFVEREMPVLQRDGDVLVKVKKVGICGSDVHILHGENPFATYPRVWGHEFVGEIAETGSAVTRVAKGDRIVAEPISYCGKCYACRQGRGNVCADLKVLGCHVDGGCQEYIVLSEKQVHKLPEHVSWEEAVLIEPFTIGAQTSLRGNVKKGDVVLVYGAGTIGLAAMQMAKINGATAIITDLVDDKLDYAKKTGADYTINASRENVYDRVMEITDGMGANVTIDAVCIKQSFEDAVKITSVAGCVVELGFLVTPSEIAAVQVTKKELAVCGSRLQTGRFPVVIDYLRQGKLNLKDFITAAYPLDKMPEAFRYIEEHGDKVRKITIDIG